MKGSHHVLMQNKRIRYEFVIRRNLTILQGNSATGKTTLIEMIEEYYENGASSGIMLHADKECRILSGKDWRNNISIIQDSLVFIDEGNEFVFTDEFASVIQHTDNYYVIVTRESIPSLPYSIEEMYGIRNSGKYGNWKQTYQEFYHLYHADSYEPDRRPDMILTEDSNSGHQFFASSEATGILCRSAGGKSNLFSEAIRLREQNPDKVIWILADGAAFGSEMEKMIRLLSEDNRLALYVPESFEWLILKSGVVEDSEVKNILENPGEFIESQSYMSWERFFTALLINKTTKTYLSYTKRRLNPAYLNKKIRNKILDAADDVLSFLKEKQEE